MTNTQITLLVAFLSSLLILSMKESVKRIVEKMFSSLSNKQVMMVFIGFVILVFGVISVFGISLFGDDNKSAGNADTANTPSDMQVKAALIKDMVNTGVHVVKDINKNAHAKDSIRTANREKQWVYQIGAPKGSETEAWEAAEIFKNVPNLFVFKESKRSFVIICDNNYSETTIQDSLSSFQNFINSISSERVVPLDIVHQCPKKKKIIEVDRITKRKQPESFRCLTCGD